jgi:hypothetical protein
MHQLHDAEVAQRLLYHLARAFGCPDAVYLAGPMRIQGGFDAAIFGFTLDRVPPPLVGPLILRLSHADADPGRVKLETVVQNTLAEMGFPAPRVMVTESDPGILGGPFMVMTRLSGQTLAHGIEGLGAGTSLVAQLRLLFNLPAILARIIDQWVDMQIRLHQLPAETLLRAVTAAGIDAGAITFEGQLAPLPLPWAVRATAHAIVGAALRRYERTYRALRPLDDRAVRYYQVFRAVAQLVGVGRARTTGRVGGGAFHSAAGVGNLIALIKKLSGVSVSLEDRMRLPQR